MAMDSAACSKETVTTCVLEPQCAGRGQSGEQAAQGGHAERERDLLGGGEHPAAHAGGLGRHPAQDPEQGRWGQSLPDAEQHHAGQQVQYAQPGPGQQGAASSSAPAITTRRPRRATSLLPSSEITRNDTAAGVSPCPS
jgi:hypothetical protein